MEHTAGVAKVNSKVMPGAGTWNKMEDGRWKMEDGGWRSMQMQMFPYAGVRRLALLEF